MQQAESSGTDYRELSDPEFLGERARVRERLEHTPERSADRAKLAELYARMTEEFDRRARAAWADAMPRQASA
jgi:hypothetical protein